MQAQRGTVHHIREYFRKHFQLCTTSASFFFFLVARVSFSKAVESQAFNKPCASLLKNHFAEAAASKKSSLTIVTFFFSFYPPVTAAWKTSSACYLLPENWVSVLHFCWFMQETTTSQFRQTARASDKQCPCVFLFFSFYILLFAQLTLLFFLSV